MGASPSDERWLALTLHVSEQRKELFADMLWSRGAKGIEETHPGLDFSGDNEFYVTDDWRVPEPANPTGRVALRAYFRNETDPEGLVTSAKIWAEGFGEEEFAAGIEPVEDFDWNSAWKEQWEASALTARVVVVPEWLEAPILQPGECSLVMDPGLAFGTGTHATTALCAEFVEETVLAKPGCRVLDVGTGTGILAVVALLLGASGAVGVDTDSAAVDVARETARKNAVDPYFEVHKGSADSVEGTWDLVVGNLLASLIIKLAEPLAARTDEQGSLVVSGLLTSQVDGVCEALKTQGMELAERRDRGEWSALRFVHGGAG